MAKLTPEQRSIDNALRRINRQIQKAATEFGKESRLFQQYETLLQGFTSSGARRSNYEAPEQARLVRENKAGIPQLMRTESAIRQIQAGAISNAIMQLQRMQTVGEAKKAMIAAYQKKTGQKVKGRAAMQAAIASELQAYQTVQTKLAAALAEMYRIEDARGGIKFRGHTEIEELSRGRWTSQEKLEEMLRIANETISAENAEIIAQQDRFAGY